MTLLWDIFFFKVDPTKDSSEKKEVYPCIMLIFMESMDSAVGCNVFISPIVQAMDSLIGEVFDDVSFNEFEETNTVSW